MSLGSTIRAAVRSRAGSPGMEVASASIAGHAEGEDALRREEALPQDRHGQNPCAARDDVAQSRQETCQAQAPPGSPGRDRRGRPDRGEAAARRRRAQAMTRVKRSVHARKKRRSVLERAKGYRGEKHSSYRRAKEQVMKSESYAYRDRRARKRDFRSLWIVRINAAARREGLSYSQLMSGLRMAGIELNRKMLAEVAVHDPETFGRFAERAKEARGVPAAGS